jgi:acetyl-CoA C-acetyltransferase
MESMSRTPYYVENGRYGYRFGDGKLIDGIGKDGLTNVYDQKAMGVCADLCATEHRPSAREEQDAFAIASYTRSANAWKEGKLRRGSGARDREGPQGRRGRERRRRVQKRGASPS